MFQNKESYFNYSLIIQLGAYSVMMWTETDSDGENLDLGADLPKGNKKKNCSVLYLLHFWGNRESILQYSNKKSSKKVKKVKSEALTD